MPIYHFNVHDGHDYPDLEGSDFADLAAARAEAVQRVANLLKAGAPDFWSGRPWHMDVADASGLTLFTMMFLATTSPLAQD